MTLCLCSEWGKAEAPLGAIGFGPQGPFSYLDRNSEMNSALGGGGGGLIRKRSLSGSGGPGQGHPTATLLNQTMMASSGVMHSNNANSGYSSDASRTLETVLNIILTLCEGTLTAVATTQQQQQQQQPQAMSPFSRQNSGINPSAVAALGALGQLQRVNSWTIARGDRDTPQSPLNQSRHDNGIGIGNGPAPGLGSGSTHQHHLSLPLLIDSAAVLCSFALRSLAEVPQCRAALVQGGALRLLRCWLELGTDVMVGIREALAKEIAQVPGQGVGPGDSSDAFAGTSSSSWTPASLQRALGPEAFRLSEYTQALDLLTNASAALM